MPAAQPSPLSLGVVLKIKTLILTMTTHNKKILILFISLFLFSGCAGFLRPSIEKELSIVGQLPKDQVDIISNAIVLNGYKAIRENAVKCDLYRSLYTKTLPTATNKYATVYIILRFIEKDRTSDHYRDLKIFIRSEYDNDSPEVREEIDRIEEILHKKLAEIAGESYVIKGKRDFNIAHPQSPATGPVLIPLRGR